MTRSLPLLIVVLAALLAACAPAAAPATPAAGASGSPASGTAAAGQAVTPAKVRFGTTAKNFLHSPIVMADKKGYFDEEKIDFSMTHLEADANVIKGMAAGEFDLTTVNLAGEINAVATGAPLVLLGGANGSVAFIFAATKDIKTLKDLEGKSVGISGIGGLTDIVVRLLLKDAGVDLAKVQLLNVGGSGARAAALTGGRVAASPFVFDYITNVEKDPNLYVMFSVGEKLPKYIQGGLATSQTYLKENRSAVVRSTRAMMRGAQYVNDPANKQEVLAVMSEFLAVPAEEISQGYDLYVKSNTFRADMALTPEEIDYMQQVNIEVGVQQQKVPLDRLADFTIREEALRTLKR